MTSKKNADAAKIPTYLVPFLQVSSHELREKPKTETNGHPPLLTQSTVTLACDARVRRNIRLPHPHSNQPLRLRETKKKKKKIYRPRLTPIVTLARGQKKVLPASPHRYNAGGKRGANPFKIAPQGSQRFGYRLLLGIKVGPNLPAVTRVRPITHAGHRNYPGFDQSHTGHRQQPAASTNHTGQAQKLPMLRPITDRTQDNNQQLRPITQGGSRKRTVRTRHTQTPPSIP